MNSGERYHNTVWKDEAERFLRAVGESLWRRGFWNRRSGTLEDGHRTYFGVLDEIGEIAKLYRKSEENTSIPNHDELSNEVADLLIATICYALTVVGDDRKLQGLVYNKMIEDEKRGFHHKGGKLRDDP